MLRLGSSLPELGAPGHRWPRIPPLRPRVANAMPRQLMLSNVKHQSTFSSHCLLLTLAPIDPEG